MVIAARSPSIGFALIQALWRKSVGSSSIRA
jgi:hypothetical protein